MSHRFETEDILEVDVPVEIGAGAIRILAPNPSVYTGKGTNTYLLVDSEATCVIDPGPDDDSHIRRIIATAPSKITSILVTHTHIDHWPGSDKLKELTGATTYGFIGKDGFIPDVNLSGGQSINFGTRSVKVLHTPGHASNHLCFLLEDLRILFTGDHLMNGATVIIPPPDGDMKAYLESLDDLLSERFEISLIAPGHGHLISDPKLEIKRVIEHRLAREAKVISALSPEIPKSIDEIISNVYSDVSQSLYPLATTSLFAHLRKLFDELKVIGITDTGLLTKEDLNAKWKLI